MGTALPLSALALLCGADPGPAPVPDAVLARGEYVFRAAGCQACHTDVKNGGRPLAGGRALKTPFGTFYTTNITPDPETGIGRWNEEDFRRALREGRGREGELLFPAFPYAAYTRLTDEDVRALFAYLRAQPPVRQENRPHELSWYARPRPLLAFWRMLYFEPGPMKPDPSRPASWNRGAYLAEAAAHCGECHTPRNALGGLRVEERLAGSRSGPEGMAVPNITPDRKTGIGRWSRGDLARYLRTGIEPSGDAAGGLMAEEIGLGLSFLRPEDLEAIAEYVLSLPPVENQLKAPSPQRKRKDFE